MKKCISIILVLSVICASLVFASVTVTAAISFSPRYEAPTTDNPYYYSQNIFYKSGYGMPNCTCYAWGRVYEASGSYPNLPTGNANTWYNNASCAKGSTPRPGAVICGNAGDSGHVAFVEKVYSDGVHFDMSESHYGGGYFDVRYNITSANFSGFQGFLYPFEGTSGHDPIGVIDGAEGGVGTVHVSGWCFDRDDLTQPLYVHVYVGGGTGTAGAEGTSIYANIAREDVDRVYNVGAFHGFDAVVPTSKSGNQEVYIYAINIGGGESTEIGHQTIYIPPDTEKPTINDSYLSLVTQDSYRVCVLPEDNVGIKSVRVATWTQADQSDLIWHNASFNSTDTYYVDIKRSDYSAVKNSFYYNHIYVYDYADNYVSVACDKDYKITSDTGYSVPEGEYRIVTAVNENRALDVADGSAENSANIQIYANFVSPKQTFNLSYINNGFYHISNSYSGRLLDVYGDTYVNNTNVVQHEYNGGANQEWMIKPSEDGYYYIIAHSNGLALDVTNALDQDGANVAVHAQNQTTAQKWKLRRVLNDDMVTVNDVTVKSEKDEIDPEITVTVDDEIIIQDGSYQVEIATDPAAGKGTVTVTGIGKYCDSVIKEFNIIVASAVLGDADGNGEVEITDATVIQRYLSDIDVPYPVEILMNADVDNSGDLSIVDATYIQRYCAYIATPYIIGETLS